MFGAALCTSFSFTVHRFVGVGSICCIRTCGLGRIVWFLGRRVVWCGALITHTALIFLDLTLMTQVLPRLRPRWETPFSSNRSSNQATFVLPQLSTTACTFDNPLLHTPCLSYFCDGPLASQPCLLRIVRPRLNTIRASLGRVSMHAHSNLIGLLV